MPTSLTLRPHLHWEWHVQRPHLYLRLIGKQDTPPTLRQRDHAYFTDTTTSLRLTCIEVTPPSLRFKGYTSFPEKDTEATPPLLSFKGHTSLSERDTDAKPPSLRLKGHTTFTEIQRPSLLYQDWETEATPPSTERQRPCLLPWDEGMTDATPPLLWLTGTKSTPPSEGTNSSS